MSRTYNIGDRFISTDGDGHYVVVATTDDPTNPLLLDWEPGDPINADTINPMTMEWAEEWLGRNPQAAPDQEASAAVVAAYQGFMAEGRAAHDALTPLEQVILFGTEEWRQSVRDDVAEFERADQAWKGQQAIVAEAARTRAEKMRNVRFLLGTQAATAKALGIDQSNVSRALALLSKEPTVTFTSTDLRDQVRTATNASDGNYDVDAIVSEIVARHGAVPVDSLDSDEFWTIVGDHAQD